MQDMKFFHKTPVQIRFNDVDVIGHVNNSVYQNYFDVARLRYFEDVLGYRLNWYDKSLVLVHIEIDFMKSVGMYDNVSVLTKVYHLGNKSLRMEQRIVGESQEDIRCVNRAVLTGYSYEDGYAISLLDEWRNKIINYEQDLDFS
jgi:acyl-CoA thioester hydrolase